MGLKTLVSHLLLCLCLVQRTTGKIASKEEWNASGCCQNCPNLTNIVHNSGSQRYVQICQHGKSGTNSYFATLFDKENKIPVFSKYTLIEMDTNSNEQNTNKKGNRNFLFEVQLVGNTTFGNIGNFQVVQQKLDLQREETWRKIKNTLAIEGDYKSDKNYQQGHLRPYAGCQNREAELATNTFTNVVPQVGSFNTGVWKSIEIRTRKLIEASRCVDNVVVVGAVPSMDKLNGRVTIPSFLWSYVKCHNHTVVVLAPNIENDLIKRYKLVTIFFTTEEELSEVLRKIRDLENKVSRIKHLRGKSEVGNLGEDQKETLTDIQETITQFKDDLQDSAKQPTKEGESLFLKLRWVGTIHEKESYSESSEENLQKSEL